MPLTCPTHGRTARTDCACCEPLRRQDAYSRWLGTLADWHLSGGLTFDPARFVGSSGPSLNTTKKRARAWLETGERHLGQQLTAVVAIEANLNGEYHLHPLLSGAKGCLTDGDTRTLEGLWRAWNGICALKPVWKPERAAAYLVKNVVVDPDHAELFFWPEEGPFPKRRRE